MLSQTELNLKSDKVEEEYITIPLSEYNALKEKIKLLEELILVQSEQIKLLQA